MPIDATAPDPELPRIEAFLAGTGDLETAARELLSLVPSEGLFFEIEQTSIPSPEAAERLERLRARVEALLEERRRRSDNVNGPGDR